MCAAGIPAKVCRLRGVAMRRIQCAVCDKYFLASDASQTMCDGCSGELSNVKEKLSLRVIDGGKCSGNSTDTTGCDCEPDSSNEL